MDLKPFRKVVVVSENIVPSQDAAVPRIGKICNLGMVTFDGNSCSPWSDILLKFHGAHAPFRKYP